ncbi:MCM21 (YDR318W) [Zygosaccharomyces parabailii]|uniref:ZYBA0S03-01684g1_1 n=1 Tax=Zygosaccharomyces bailii (strain CLIB 213 / ATCC 58445 / CBS 680 / BCRC 21525 / NBRC 1098 / NCYC 1416 / NRRL Y-2227) TaxID=1333698 RepID=A0A8J2X9P9_ZYGB2|nr:MCM21 (YDR318W) [Zygosaccharomyces parabailii]CDF88776.1 ZYBA0S03-01684g1_1 [Zygosaccharomyces bailii CLIB 213]CDH15866.1 related to Central kinetochore subunit MCM21 [Zygosaccharomyces bailii ISA1307]
MQDIEDLEQDLDSLLREISVLTKRRDELKALKFEKECSELSNHPVVKEFESLFDRFPRLYEALSRETIDANLNDGVSANPNPKNSVIKKRTADSEDGSVNVPRHNMFNKTIASLMDNSPSKRSNTVRGRTLIRDLESKVQLENVYRLFGITFFPVVDPSDLLNNATGIEVERRMLGVRLEVYNEQRSLFEKPHYILLKQEMKSTSWRLFKDTIPLYVDLELIFQKINGGIITTWDDVYLFAKQVYTQLLAVSMRLQTLEELRELGLIEELDVDLRGSAVSFSVHKAEVQLILQGDEVASCNTTDEDLRAFLLGPITELKPKLQQLSNS